MSAGLLPQCVNIRKAVTRSARYEGTVGAAEMGIGNGVPAPAEPGVAVTVEFGEDDEMRQFARIELTAKVTLECQRCLGPVVRTLHSSSSLGLVRSDDEARQLPASYEPWVAIDEVDLWKMAAEEFALALPVVAYHDRSECQAPGSQERDEAATVLDDGAAQRNPFSVLSSLLEDGSESIEE